MNGLHHEDLTRVACHLAGIRGAHADRMIAASNATWAQFYFGSARRYEECSVTDMLAVCIRAVASSRHALRLMRCA